MLAATTIRRVFPRHFLRQFSLQNIDMYAVPRASRRSLDDEVVEDSEPEREALRQTQKLERKKRKLAAMNEPAATAAKASPTRVIFISDGSVPASPVAAPAASLQLPINVIEISDSSTSISVDQNVISLHSSTSGTNLNRTAAHIAETAKDCLHVGVAAPLASLTDSGHSDDEEIVPTLNLTRFAFANPRPLQPQNSASTIDSTSNSDTQTKPPAKKAARSSSKSLAGGFSDAELGKLVKCVSCDIAWTARKSAAQKLVHIRSCAKKTGLTDDTVRILIRKELDNAPDEPGPSKRNGKAPLVPTIRTTLLEDVVHNAAPKRKGKRKEAVDTLKNISETRENIRGRAHMIFGSGPLSDDDSFMVQTQAITANATPRENCATQAFGPSRLAQQQGYKPSILGERDSDEEPNLPPATQAFAPSKLGGRIVATGWGYESESGNESSAAELNALSPKNPRNLPFHASSSAKEVSPRSSPRAKKKTIAAAAVPPSPVMHSDCDDDAYVHFDPEMSLKSIKHKKTNTSTAEKRTKTIRESKESKPPKKKRVQVPTDADEPLRSPSPKAKPKRSRKKAEDEFDERWEFGLKEKILEDRDLHLRILRYEPINFDVFLKLATGEEIAGGRLIFKLRAFLDKQAINFYGGEATKTRRRR